MSCLLCYYLTKGGAGMSKLAVKYNNDLNEIPLRNFTAVELDLFITICANIKEKGTDVVVYDFQKLRQLSKYEQTSNAVFIKDLRSTYSKLLATSYTLENERFIESFTLFNRFKIDKDEQTVEIQVNEAFKYILNDLNLGKFTRFELQEYTSIVSTYSKALYMRLKQYKDKGFWSVTIDDFRRLLAVPESYKMGNIDQKILNPALKDLSPYFDKLKIKKLDRNKRSSGRGRPVKYIQFTFTPQDDKKEWLEAKTKKPKANEAVYGQFENVYLSELEINTIVYDWQMKYLIEELSEWKHKANPKTSKSDFDLIKDFKAKKQKDQMQNILDLY